jgi:hypothetical protein
MARVVGNKVVGLGLMTGSSMGLAHLLKIGPLGAAMILVGFIGLCLYVEEMRHEALSEMDAHFSNFKVLLKSLKYRGAETAEGEQEQEGPR